MGQYQRPCALKRVFNAERHERFREEVEAIKTLSHPNIVPLFDHSALDAVPGDDARQYLVMPRAEGGNLAKAVDRYRGRLDDVLTVAIQIAHGLQAAHAARIIHRDVKPENILFPGEGHAIWVADFGICLIQAREQRNTRDGEVVGPAVFMAPELEDGGQLAVTPDADIYSLGKVIYNMITGGVRMPRERLHEEAYAAPFAAGGRLLRLKILLSQMICARPYRIQAMPEVIRRLEAIAAEAASEPPDAFNTAAIDRLKQAALADRSRVQDQADEEARRQAWFNDVHMDILALVHGELAAHAARLTEPGLIKSGAQPLQSARRNCDGPGLKIPGAGWPRDHVSARGRARTHHGAAICVLPQSHRRPGRAAAQRAGRHLAHASDPRTGQPACPALPRLRQSNPARSGPLCLRHRHRARTI